MVRLPVRLVILPAGGARPVGKVVMNSTCSVLLLSSEVMVRTSGSKLGIDVAGGMSVQ
jgi:hypothetical protein